VLDHQAGQFGSVDQDKADVDSLGDYLGVGSEPAGGDEDSTAGLCALETADEPLDVWPAHHFVRIAPGLQVDDVQAPKVQPYQAVQSLVPWPAEGELSMMSLIVSSGKAPVPAGSSSARFRTGWLERSPVRLRVH
jgi:hypothetical protein